MHVHHLQPEALTVAEGRIGYRVAGGATKNAGPGETVLFRAGAAHAFWADGDEILRCSGWISPPHDVAGS